MDTCEREHKHIYKITYKPTPGTKFYPQWLVCKDCYETKRYFSNDEEIFSIEPIKEKSLLRF